MKYFSSPLLKEIFRHEIKNFFLHFFYFISEKKFIVYIFDSVVLQISVC